MTPLWSIRPCMLCGRSVKCEPNFPDDVKVACWRCIQGEPPEPGSIPKLPQSIFNLENQH